MTNPKDTDRKPDRKPAASDTDRPLTSLPLGKVVRKKEWEDRFNTEHPSKRAPEDAKKKR